MTLGSTRAFDRDFLEEVPQAKPYLKMLGERPVFAKVKEDLRSAQAAAAAKAKEKAASA